MSVRKSNVVADRRPHPEAIDMSKQAWSYPSVPGQTPAKHMSYSFSLWREGSHS